jgi:hypothetical protein
MSTTMPRTTMTTRLTSTLLAAGVGAALALGTGVAIAQTGDDGDDATSTAEVVETLQLTLEEERMARDLYDELGKAHDGLAPFGRIKLSEQRHYDAVSDLISAQGGTVPEAGAAGEFEDEEIQAMYDDWLERGLVSPDAALEVAVELETADIQHLRSTIEEIDDADVDRVLGHLLRASEHHLAAFEAAAAGELPDGMGRGEGPRGGPGRGMGGRQGSEHRPGMERGQGWQQGAGDQRGPGPHQGQGRHQHADRTGGCPMTTSDDA